MNFIAKHLHLIKRSSVHIARVRSLLPSFHGLRASRLNGLGVHMTALARAPVMQPLPSRTALATGPRAVFVPTIADLCAIYQEDVNLVVLSRTLAPSVQSVVRELAAGPDFTATLRVYAPQPDLSSLPFADHERAAPLLADMTCWLQAFCELFDAEQVGLRICHSRSVMCPRFHIDRVPVRLVCAYSGPSMQWLAEPDVDRSRLGHRAGGLSDEESGLIRRSDAIQQIPPQAIALCRGDSWPGRAGRALVHRSPANLGDGSARMVMTLDML